MGNLQLDSLDKKILETLSQNARKPYLEIARECNVSGAAIHQRIQKLHTMGIIKGSESLIDPNSVGYETCAYIGFFLNDTSKFDEIVSKLRDIPEVVECHLTTGKYDLLIKLFDPTGSAVSTNSSTIHLNINNCLADRISQPPFSTLFTFVLISLYSSF